MLVLEAGIDFHSYALPLSDRLPKAAVSGTGSCRLQGSLPAFVGRRLQAAQFVLRSTLKTFL
jgi:hypothetical protein